MAEVIPVLGITDGIYAITSTMPTVFPTYFIILMQNTAALHSRYDASMPV